MLGYRKRSFFIAHSLLRELRANLENLEVLKSLQQLLFREIVRTETKIRQLKSELRSVQAIRNKNSAKRSSYLRNRIDKVRQVAFTWRCFGDAIAFLYMDRFALKQCFYSIENQNPKQDAGFLSDKSGLYNELLLLEEALASGVPALLTDLTNTIRHGDICLMGESDPYLIEVKTSKELNSRGKRQRRALTKLREFFETDRADDLRGFSNIRRAEIIGPEQTRIDELKACIDQAIEKGVSVCQPELGLVYIAVTDSSAEFMGADLLSEIKSPWGYLLNEFKSKREWAPFYPFTLSILDADHLWNFIRGNLYLSVLFDEEAACTIAKAKGHEINFDRENDLYPLRVKLPDSDQTAGISRQMISRIAMEFLSLEWAITTFVEIVEKGHQDFAAETGTVEGTVTTVSI